MQKIGVESHFFHGTEKIGKLFTILFLLINENVCSGNVYFISFHCIFRSKSKDRGESEYNKTPSRSETIYKSFTVIKRETEGNNNEDTVSISSSRSSLASWDLALRQSFNKHVSIIVTNTAT